MRMLLLLFTGGLADHETLAHVYGAHQRSDVVNYESIRRRQHAMRASFAELLMLMLLLLVMMTGDGHGRVQHGGRRRREARRDEVVPRAGTCRVRAAPVAAAVRRRRRRPGRRRPPDHAQLVPVGAQVQQAERALEAPVETTGAQSLVESAQYVNALHDQPQSAGQINQSCWVDPLVGWVGSGRVGSRFFSFR